MQQYTLMKFDPTNRSERPYPSDAKQYRKWNGKIAWLFNPWTGEKRDPRDIGSDVTGILIIPPGEKTYSQCGCMAANRAELLAEDIECLHMALDDYGVIRFETDGKELSLWGRVMRFKFGN